MIPSLRRLLAAFVATQFIVGLVGYVVWIIPAYRPEFVPTVGSWVGLVFTFATFLWLALESFNFLLRNKYFIRVISIVIAGLLFYTAIAFLLERLGAAPAASLWLHPDTSVIAFLFIYTAIFLVAILTFVYVNQRPGILIYLVGRVSKLSSADIQATLKFIIVYFGIAILLGLMGIGPYISAWLDNLLSTLVFFVMYTLLLIAIYSFYEFIKYLLRPISADVPAYSLYGPTTAWFIQLSIYGTILLQIAAFFTSYFGFKLILPEFLPDQAAISFNIPQKISEILDIHDRTMTLSQNELISTGSSLVFSVFISVFAAWALHNLLENKRIPLFIPLAIFVLGLMSSYCGFTRWNSSPATAYELLRGVQETKTKLDNSAEVDARTLEVAASEVKTEFAALVRKLDQKARAALETRRLELEMARKVQGDSFQTLANEFDFAGEAKSFRHSEECEAQRGCITTAAGGGAISEVLGRIVVYLDSADLVVKADKSTQADLEKTLDETSAKALADTSNHVPASAIEEDLHNFWTSLAKYKKIDIRPVMKNLASQLSTEKDTPLVIVFDPKPDIKGEQERVLNGLKENIASFVNRLNTVIRDNRVAEIPVEGDDKTSGGGEIQIKADFSSFSDALISLYQARQEKRIAIAGELSEIFDDIETSFNSGKMIASRARITNSINDARSQLNQLRTIDLDGVRNAAERSDEESQTEAADIKALFTIDKIVALLPDPNSYPKIGDFSLTLLSYGVLKYFYLALPALIVQMLVDFGFTLAVIYAAWSMSKKSPRVDHP